MDIYDLGIIPCVIFTGGCNWSSVDMGTYNRSIMAAKKVGSSNRGRKAKPILKSAIEEAQRHTNSNRQAAIYLGVAYPTYKRYAKIYGIFDRHANPLGLGTTKGFGKRPSTISLRDIFANKHPEYSMIRLKYRMVARNMLDEKCGVCGFSEKRITDKKTPLMLTFKNQIGDFSRDNLHLKCYNCMFLTTGAPWVAHQKQIVNSLINPNAKPRRDDEPRYMDSLDKEEDTEIEQTVQEHRDDIRDLQAEILRELGR